MILGEKKEKFTLAILNTKIWPWKQLKLSPQLQTQTFTITLSKEQSDQLNQCKVTGIML